MYIAVLFTWALMTTTRALTMLPSCLELCKADLSVPKPVACNCVDLVRHINRISMYSLGDKGIYYRPIDLAAMQSVTIPSSELNIHAHNPNTKSNPNKQNVSIPSSDLNFNRHNPNTESNPNKQNVSIPSSLFLFHPLNKVHHTEKPKQEPNLFLLPPLLPNPSSDKKKYYSLEPKTEDSGKNRTKKHEQRDEYIEETQSTSSKPLYIDIEISKMETSETFSREAETDTIDQGNAKYLEECLDIHSLLHFRINHTIPKLNEKGSTEKLVKYMNLTDAELLKESIEKCSHPSDVVKQSMNEIKQSLPPKLGGGKLHVKNIIKHHSYTKVSSKGPDMLVQIKSMSTGKIINIDNNGTSTSVETKHEHISTNEHKRNTSKTVDNKRAPVEWSIEDKDNDTKTLKRNLKNNTIISPRTSPTYDVSTVDDRFIKKKNKSISFIKIRNIQRENNNASEIYTANPIPKTSTDELTGIATDTPQNIEPSYNDFPRDTSSLESATEIVDNLAVHTTTVTNCDNCKELSVTKKAIPDTELQNTAITANDIVASAASTTKSVANPDNELQNTAIAFNDIVPATASTTKSLANPDNELQNTAITFNDIVPATASTTKSLANPDNELQNTALTLDDIFVPAASTTKSLANPDNELQNTAITLDDIFVPAASTTKSLANPDNELQNTAITLDDIFVPAASTTKSPANPAVMFAKSAGAVNVYDDNTTSVYETTTETKLTLNGSNSHSKKTHRKVLKDAWITGNMYFNIHNRNIPARFIQDPAGHIAIGIDLIALCNKLRFSGNGPALIRQICKHLHSPV